MKITRSSLLCAAAVTMLLAGCSSSKRTTVDGYTDAMLTGKRVALLVPDVGDVKLESASNYAAARGTTGEAAREQLSSDLRAYLVPALDAELDSNIVLNYKDEPMGAQQPLSATTDFTSSGPVSWDLVDKAARAGNLDYLVVVRSMTIQGTSANTARGSETINAEYLLLDLPGKKVMAHGQVSASVQKINSPGETYTLLAQQLSGRLPFIVRAQ